MSLPIRLPRQLKTGGETWIRTKILRVSISTVCKLTDVRSQLHKIVKYHSLPFRVTRNFMGCLKTIILGDTEKIKWFFHHFSIFFCFPSFESEILISLITLEAAPESSEDLSMDVSTRNDSSRDL